MAKSTGFMEYTREDAPKRPSSIRIHDYREFEERLPKERLVNQAARCMDCGVPSCHVYGCPTQNRIPDWNDLVYRDKWKLALDVLHSTDNFPEFTGRVCPAPCEAACTLSINQPAVTIRNIELQIVERGWEEGWVVPEPAAVKTGKKVAVIGSGPAGLAAAQNIARKGHNVTVFEKADRIGGLLRYGIPDFKLEKNIIDRRLKQMEAEGVNFETSVDVGRDISVRYLQRTFDAVVITAGSTIPRDLPIKGRDLDGVHYAMDFLIQQNKRNAGDKINPKDAILATDKNVVVIGGGDTGSDCVGTSNRQGAKSVTQIELLSKPPKDRNEDNPWPTWPLVMRTSSSHSEGCKRDWSILTKEIYGKNNKVEGLRTVRLEWTKPQNGERPAFKEIPKSEFDIKADLVLLAMGFIHVEQGPLVKDFGLELNSRGDIVTDAKLKTVVPGVFAAGDAATGASLVVRAIHQGRIVADSVDEYLAGI